MLKRALPWREPLEFARAIPEEEACWALLYSSLNVGYSGHTSYLALYPEKTIQAEDFSALETELTNNLEPLDNAWFGYLGYGLKNALEQLTVDAKGTLDMPALWMVKYSCILVFEHATHQLTAFARDETAMARVIVLKTRSKPAQIPLKTRSNPSQILKSNMTKNEYLAKVSYIKQCISSGDVYQANLTRKFFGEFKLPPKPLDLFNKLAHISPSPYSALLRFKNTFLLSSSPERFLNIAENGQINARPIKGSAPRFKNASEDENSFNYLKNSEKDRSENLMIVDLMRNDLARGSVINSIYVPILFNVASYSTVHHMSSSISALKNNDISTLKLISHCFPPGSMTGTPKIQAMELCSKLESLERGIYSGALGWFGGDGSADFSVVIRTLIIQKNYFEFQVGGAIVAESDPEKEWQETLFKAKALINILGISPKTLEAL